MKIPKQEEPQVVVAVSSEHTRQYAVDALH